MSSIEWPRHEDERAAWILNRYGFALFQRRRGEKIRKRMWEVERELAGANPSQYTEVVTAPLHERPEPTVAYAKEALIVLAGVVFLPFAWIAGKLLYKALERLVPDKIDAYPTTLLAAAAGGLSLLTGAAMRFADLTVLEWLYVPFLVAQLPGAFFVAALYGILEGWLGVKGSTEWLPQAEKTIAETEFELLEPDVRNAPSLLPRAEVDGTGFRVPAPPKALDIFLSRKPKP